MTTDFAFSRRHVAMCALNDESAVLKNILLKNTLLYNISSFENWFPVLDSNLSLSRELWLD